MAVKNAVRIFMAKRTNVFNCSLKTVQNYVNYLLKPNTFTFNGENWNNRQPEAIFLQPPLPTGVR